MAALMLSGHLSAWAQYYPGDMLGGSRVTINHVIGFSVIWTSFFFQVFSQTFSDFLNMAFVA